MGRYILKLDDKYCEWSTVTDSPRTNLMSLEKFRKYYRDEYGADGMSQLQQRMDRVEKTGTRAHSKIKMRMP